MLLYSPADRKKGGAWFAGRRHVGQAVDDGNGEDVYGRIVIMDTNANHLAPQAARLAPKLRALADRGVYFGTSSWKYDGWLGSIYSEDRYVTRGKFSKAKFEENCLAEYARTFPTVCGDLTFYQFPSEQYWAKLFEATPGDFIFGFKVPEDITVETWPTHARYGKRAGLRNENFLNAEAFAQFFTNRLVRYGKQVGPLIFEFGTFNKKTFAQAGRFPGGLRSVSGGAAEGIPVRRRDQERQLSDAAVFRRPGEPQRRPRLQRLDPDARARPAGSTSRRIHGRLHGRPGSAAARPALRRGCSKLRAVRPNQGAQRERTRRHADDRRAGASVATNQRSCS